MVNQTFKYNELDRAAYLPTYIRKRSINNTTKRNNRRNNGFTITALSPEPPRNLDHVMPSLQGLEHNVPNGRVAMATKGITRYIAKPTATAVRRNVTRKTQATINRELAKLQSEKTARLTNLRSKGLIMSRNERNRFATREAKIRSQR